MSSRTSRLVLLVGFVVAGLPYVLACWRAWRQGWLPTGDNARLTADAVALKTTAPPLLGIASDSMATTTGISPVHHPGPFETWILGTVHLVVPGAVGILVGVLLIGLTAVLLSLLAARALWGVGGVAVTAMCVSVAASSLGTMVLATPWNPYVVILPSAALVLSAWAWLLGRWAPGLPAAVLLACFCAQSHITQIPVAAAAIAPPVVLLLVRRWLPFAVPTPPHGRWLVGGSIVAGVATWIPPVYFERSPAPTATCRTLPAPPSTGATTRRSARASASARSPGSLLPRHHGDPGRCCASCGASRSISGSGR